MRLAAYAFLGFSRAMRGRSEGRGMQYGAVWIESNGVIACICIKIRVDEVLGSERK